MTVLERDFRAMSLILFQFIFFQYYEAEKELENANQKLKDMTIVLEQRNGDIAELRKQNRETSTKDNEKV